MAIAKRASDAPRDLPAAHPRSRDGSRGAGAPPPELRAAVGAAALVASTRNRARARVSPPDRRSGLLTGGLFTVVVATWLVLAPPSAGALPLLLACIASHAVASSVEFEIGPGSALPTTPSLIVALFLLPPPLVPLVAVSGLTIAALVARLRDPDRHERLIVLAGSGWHAVGPAAVFAIAHVGQPALADWPIYLAALGAQFAADAASSWVRNCYGLGVPVASLAAALRFTFVADLLLAPVGLTAAMAAPGSATALLLILPPTILLAVLQRDRRAQITTSVALGRAYAETADRARRDALTGLANRLAWEEGLAAHADDAVPIGLVLADVDGLKAANDMHGHDVGDRLLIAVADLVRRAVPPGDGVVVARLGGDEFGILLPDTLAPAAEQVATLLRSALARSGPVAGAIRMSASVGWSVAADGGSLPFACLAADRRVYQDKSRRSAGRD